MKIDEKMIDPGSEIYYQKGFMDILETYVIYLRNLSMIRTIEEKDKAVYDGDFYGYLNSLNIPMFMHWPLLRINGMTHANQFGRNTVYLKVFPSSELDKLRQLFLKTNNSIGL